MASALEAEYFEWLCRQISDPSNSKTRRLLHILHQTEFVWLVSGDDNRAEDGTDLRSEFLDELDLSKSNLRSFEGGCSVLELLIAFSRIAYFETDDSEESWFWRMIQNLSSSVSIDLLELSSNDVVAVLERFIWRNYDRKGNGGLFPMRRTRNDQRKIEIWYQFSEYLLEHSHS